MINGRMKDKNGTTPQEPFKCPHCKSTNISHGDTHEEPNHVYWETECNSCDFKWTEDFVYVGFVIKE